MHPLIQFRGSCPRLAITLGMVLFLVCVGVVAYYAQHITHSIRVGSALDRVVSDALRFAEPADESGTTDGRPLPEPPQDSVVVLARRSGYLQGADLDGLAEIARRHHATIRLRPMIGDLVVDGGPIAWMWPAGDGDSGHELGDIDALGREIDDATDVAGNRTLDQDVTYGLRQLVDVAIRAMSPSLNDPYTAVEAIDHLTRMLCRLAERPMGGRVRTDDNGRLLVAMPGPDLLSCVELASDQIRRYGVHEPAIAVRLLILLREVAFRSPPDARSWLHLQVQRVVDDARAAGMEDADLRHVHAAAEVARAWIDDGVVADDAVFVRL